MKDILKLVRGFCKRNIIADRKLADVYLKFRDNYPEISPEQFEQAMLELKTTPARKSKKLCLEYASKHGSAGYTKMIKEQEHVTLSFWYAVTDPPKKEKPPPSPLPEEPTSVEEEIAVPEEIPRRPIRKIDRDAYAKLLPVNWTEMTYSNMVNFTKRVQHEGFREYIFSKNEKLRKYFERLPKKSDVRMGLYVTLFSFKGKEYDNKAKELLRRFVTMLNGLGRARFEYIELKDPGIVEIRELRK